MDMKLSARTTFLTCITAHLLELLGRCNPVLRFQIGIPIPVLGIRHGLFTTVKRLAGLPDLLRAALRINRAATEGVAFLRRSLDVFPRPVARLTRHCARSSVLSFAALTLASTEP